MNESVCSHGLRPSPGAKAPTEIALRAAALLDAFSFLDIADIAEEANELASAVAGLYFTPSERFGIDNLLKRITELPQADRWQDAARSALRDDLYSALADLTRAVLAEGEVREPRGIRPCSSMLGQTTMSRRSPA